MTGIHGLHMRVDIGYRQAAFRQTAIEVLLVAFERLAFVQLTQFSIAELVFVPVLFDW